MPPSTRSTRLVRALAAVAMVAAGLTACTQAVSGNGHDAGTSAATQSSPSGGTSAPAQPAAKFTDCSSLFDLSGVSFPPGRREKLHFTCAHVPVPLNYADPAGKTISLEVIKVHDSDDSAPTGLLVNPGGPGGSGVELAVGLATEVSDALLKHFDIIGFDPRGVSLSAPIRCVSDSEKDTINATNADIRTTSGFATAKQLATKVANDCTNKYGPDLAQYDTVNTAKDMDRIRQAIGQDRMSYLGFSYGTELGAQYIHLFPDKIRVAVLDGAVDPLTDDITSFADQLKGFEGAFDQFAADCKTRSSCSKLGDPRQVVYELTKQADANPIPSRDSGETRKATGAIVLLGVLSALYSQSGWERLGQSLIDARSGDSAGLFALADEYNQRYPGGTYSNIYDANTTIACNDAKPGPTDDTIRATADAWASAYPMFGLWAAQSLFSCQVWQPTRTPPSLPTAPNSSAKILVIGNLHDPATPYQGAKDLTKTLGNAELLTWDGEGHTSYLQGSTCVDAKVDKYLIEGTLPAAGTTCPR